MAIRPDHQSTVDTLSNKLSGLPSLSHKGYNTGIYKVPKKLRSVSEEAYRPRLVSIGPLHHGSAHLQAMELYKVRCLEFFLKISGFELEGIVDCAEYAHSTLQLFYQEKIERSHEEIIEMLVLDSVFIIVLFLKNYSPQQNAANRDELDLILDTKWMVHDLLHDLVLLENQLPCIILFGLFDIVKANSAVVSHQTDFNDLILKFFKYVGNTDGLVKLHLESMHLLHYLLEIHIMIQSGIPGLEINSESIGMPEYPYNATALHEAGVKFSVSTQRSLLDIVFKDGFLKMPKLIVNEWTKTFFLNLIAFEQCAHRPALASSYVIFMDSLINTSNDVDILVKHGIIENFLGDSEQVSHLFNNLYKETVTEDSYFHFSPISKELNDYSKSYWHQWKAAWFKWKLILKRDYFSNPWTVISVIAAIILLGLTVTQTVCSVIAL